MKKIMKMETIMPMLMILSEWEVEIIMEMMMMFLSDIINILLLETRTQLAPPSQN
jgi:hypothetical protein